MTNAPENRDVEVIASGTGISDGATATSDAGGSLSLLLDVGSMGKAQRVQATSVGNSSTGFVFGFGADFVFFGGEDPGLRSDFTRVLETDDSGTDFTVVVEYGFWPRLGIGFSYERLSEIGLDGTLTFIEDPDFTIDSSGTIDPKVAELYALLKYAVTPRAVVHGIIGAGYWTADTNSTEILFFEDHALETSTSSASNHGWSPVVGAGLDYWFRDWIGGRVAFKWVRLKDTGNDGADLDRSATAARILLLLNLSNLAR